MEYLIKEAFLYDEGYGPHVAEGMYDLVGPHGEIIMKPEWGSVIESGWEISMHMWPLPEPPEEPPEVDEGSPPYRLLFCPGLVEKTLCFTLCFWQYDE